jgi:hypothetical protein
MRAAREVTLAMLALSELDARRVDDRATLERLVRGHDLDAGLVLSAGFDAALHAGERPCCRSTSPARASPRTA